MLVLYGWRAKVFQFWTPLAGIASDAMLWVAMQQAKLKWMRRVVVGSVGVVRCECQPKMSRIRLAVADTVIGVALFRYQLTPKVSCNSRYRWVVKY